MNKLKEWLKSNRLLVRLLLLPLLLYSFFLAKFPLELILILGMFFLLVILFRSHAYNKIELHLGERFPFIHDWHPWKKKALIILVFIFVFGVIKQLLYFSLNVFFGFDIEQMLLESMNSSLENSNI